MFTYAQLQAGVEADQLYFSTKAQTFAGTYRHCHAHNDLDGCQFTCPFINKKIRMCGLPSKYATRVYFFDSIRKHNPEYLL